MTSIAPTDQFVYMYQVPGRALNDVLQGDRDRLGLLQQPGMLNDHLQQLYQEIEAEKRVVGDDLGLERDNESSPSTSSTDDLHSNRRQLRREVMEFRQTMLYEENAPFPKSMKPPS